ncbi:MAG: ATPase [Tissierellaceae bacterium]|jgi:DNA repair exonuclease SbcCD ATPase subunit
MIDNIQDLEREIVSLRDFFSRENGKREKLVEQLNQYNAEMDEILSDVQLLEKVVVLFQKTSEFAREQARVQIESLVTKCLQFIFGNDIEFSIEIEELRNKANAEFYVVSESDNIMIKTKPELSRGGGVVDIVSLALRIAFLQIYKPSIQGPLILDEPAKHVSEDYIYNVGDFLKQTSEMFNRQIIMVTHNQHLSALSDYSYRVSLNGSKSNITRVEL